jgi:signal transduction histidine kinase
VILSQVDADHVLNPILYEKGIKSMLGVPLVMRGVTTGVLHVGTLVPREFTATDVELLQLVAERVAISVERAQLHEETVLLDQMKLNFVAIASHELRTPATSVYGVFATLVARDLPDELRDELIATGFDQADRLRRLLEELLDLSRLDAHAIAIEPRPLVVHSVLAQIVVEALGGEAEIELDVPADLAVIADPLVIERVVSNLLINASRYGKPPFVVHARRSDHHLRIAVEDRGAGVPDELRPRLFDRFARADTSNSSGLGLAIARSYARAHGGDLFYEPLETGSRFELLVPQD